ncbi:hypothetical protein [Burkholderia oklahomensis]|uniref:hypothetical protein n=1 Tax=Burkholderia oklahomensis TaxID=342113 RepID=UPI0012F51364|nr:hypothetical protein [Burkholderia oklahomensis]MBI0364202.1 hypothetical protein [Burkholderia oklahomensis]
MKINASFQRCVARRASRCRIEHRRSVVHERPIAIARVPHASRHFLTIFKEG